MVRIASQLQLKSSSLVPDMSLLYRGYETMRVVKWWRIMLLKKACRHVQHDHSEIPSLDR